MQGSALLEGTTGEWLKEVKGYEVWNAWGDGCSHTSCFDSLTYPAVEYFVFMWKGETKTDSYNLRTKRVSGDEEHVGWLNILHMHVHPSLQMCLHKTDMDKKITPLAMLTLSNIVLLFHSKQANRPSAAYSQTLEGAVSQQGSLENDPSSELPQRDVLSTALVIIQSKHLSWRM